MTAGGPPPGAVPLRWQGARMNGRIGLEGVLEEHRLWVETRGKRGKRADLRGARLQNASLRGALLQSACLENGDLKWADLREADLRKANLKGVDLLGASLQKARLQRADLRWADMRGTDLRGVNLTRAIGLTEHQIRTAVKDDRTKLPKDLQ